MCFSVKIERDLKKLSAFFNAMPVPRAFQKLKRGTQEFPKVFKIPGEDNIIYPNIFAPVIVYANGQKLIRPMRYRIRPAGSREEVPTKYNLFNARLDSLFKKKTWKRLVGVNHCLFPFREFYEWVPGGKNGKKRLVTFYPLDREIMWAPGLFDSWVSQDGSLSFESFALITVDPPSEVFEQGHDRSPLFLDLDFVDEWLTLPEKKGPMNFLDVLSKRQEVTYGHSYG